MLKKSLWSPRLRPGPFEALHQMGLARSTGILVVAIKGAVFP